MIGAPRGTTDMLRRTSAALALAATGLVPPAGAQDGDALPLAPLALRWSSTQGFEIPADRPDRHAPIGIVGDHAAESGAWILSYRFLRSDHDGLIDGESEVTEDEVFGEGFVETPESLVRETHFLSALYGIDERVSFLVTLPWVSNAMDSVTFAGETFDTRTIGLGDVRFTGLYSLRRKEEERFELSLGVSLPTGSTDEKDATPSTGGQSLKLPYPMQLGSGTVDLHPGLTFVRFAEETSWGAQVQGTLRLGENSDDYTLGDRVELSAWIARLFQEDLSGSLRVAFVHEGEIDGRDEDIDPTITPAADPDAQGGDRFDVFVGVHYTRPGGHRFAAELGGPLLQDLNGPQVEADVYYALGWQFSF